MDGDERATDESTLKHFPFNFAKRRVLCKRCSAAVLGCAMQAATPALQLPANCPLLAFDLLGYSAPDGGGLADGPAVTGIRRWQNACAGKEASMTHYSILVPQRDRAEEFARQLPALRAAMDRLRLPYEIICIDDGSAPLARQVLEHLLTEQPAMRLLMMDAPAGASVALSVGMAAAHGEIVIAIEAGQPYAAEQIPHLIARLSRLDLVYARRRLVGWPKFLHRVGRIPRAMLLGLDVRQPECLLWAARREAIAGIHLSPGMRRYLPWMVARRGFRVGDMYVDEAANASTAASRTADGTTPSTSRLPALPDGGRHPMDLLTAWWLCRRWRNDSCHEIGGPQATIPISSEPASRQTYRAKSA